MIETFIEVRIDKEEDFLKVKETLTRIGIASNKEKKLMQSCHILHKRGKYYIVHFKELYALDGKNTDYTDDDRARRNTIAGLLEEWGLVHIVNPDVCKEPKAPMFQIKIISHKEKDQWELVPMYYIGRKR